MIASNLFEILAIVTLGYPPLMAMVVGVFFKHVIETRQPQYNDDFAKFNDYENGYAFVFAWFGGLILLAIYGPLYWIDIWEATNHIESTVYIFVLWILCIFFKWGWFKLLYIKRTDEYRWMHAYLILDLVASLAFALLILLTLHEDDSHWYHWLSLLLLVPPIFGWVATDDADKYRSPNSLGAEKNNEPSFTTSVRSAVHGVLFPNRTSN